MGKIGEFKDKSEDTITKVGISTIEAGLKETPKSNEKNVVAFDDALAETKFGKFNYFIIFVAGIIIGYAVIETLGVSYILPVSQCDLNLTTNEKRILSAISFIGFITSSHLWGFLADTIGRRKTIRPTLFMSCTMAALSSLANRFWLFVILRYLTGFFACGGSGTIYVYLGEFHTNKTRSRAIMGASFVFGFAFALLPLVAWLVINQEWSFYIPYLGITYKPWRLFLVVCGLPGLFCALCLFKIPESPKFTLSQGQQTETLNILKKVYSMNTGKSGESYKINCLIEDSEAIIRPKASATKSNPIALLLGSIWEQTAPLFMSEHLRKTVLACIIQFVILGTSNGLYMWFPGILNEMAVFRDQNPLNRTTICQVVHSNKRKALIEDETVNCNEKLELSTYHQTLLLEVLYILGFAVMGFIINAIGKIPILSFILIGCGASGVAMVFVDIPVLPAYLFVILLLCGLGVQVVNAAMVDLYPTHLRAMAVCISLMMGRLGSVVAANLGGLLLDENCEAAFLTSGVLLIFCGFLSFLLPIPKEKTKKKRRVSVTSMSGVYIKTGAED